MSREEFQKLSIVEKVKRLKYLEEQSLLLRNHLLEAQKNMINHNKKMRVIYMILGPLLYAAAIFLWWGK